MLKDKKINHRLKLFSHVQLKFPNSVFDLHLGDCVWGTVAGNVKILFSVPG